MNHILVINCGSSTIKFKMYDECSLSLLYTGKVDKIGNSDTSISIINNTNTDSHYSKIEENDYSASINHIYEWVNENFNESALKLVAHRVVHGGYTYRDPIAINDHVLNEIEYASRFAPLHNENSLIGIHQSQKYFKNAKQIAVFDTGFFKQLPLHAACYPIPKHYYDEHKIMRYGFHGISHKYITRQTSNYLGISENYLNIISMHLGNGSSLAAIKGGVAVDTTMGLTPLEGLMMGTRCGDIDPAIILHMSKHLELNTNSIEECLNKRSGFKGICGKSDIRDINALLDNNDDNARLAVNIFCYRIKKYIGAYLAVLGHVDAIVFTGGIGENDSNIRQIILSDMQHLNICLDTSLNTNLSNDKINTLSSKDESIKLMVVPTDEEYEIACSSLDLA